VRRQNSRSAPSASAPPANTLYSVECPIIVQSTDIGENSPYGST
jgi:hypothetical protein